MIGCNLLCYHHNWVLLLTWIGLFSSILLFFILVVTEQTDAEMTFSGSYISITTANSREITFEVQLGMYATVSHFHYVYDVS